MDEMDPGWSHGTVREDGNAIGCEIGKLRPVRQHRVGRGTRRTGSLRVWTQHAPGRGEDSRLGRSKIPGPDGEQKRCPRQNDDRSGNEQSKLLQRERSNTGERNQAPSLGTICRLDPDRVMPGERRERAWRLDRIGKVCWNIGSENHTCEHHAQPRFRSQCMHPNAGARLTCNVACLGRVESRLHAEMYGQALRRKAICGSDSSTALRSHRACCHRIALISSCPGIYACPYLRSNPGWLRGEGSGSRGSLGGFE